MNNPKNFRIFPFKHKKSTDKTCWWTVFIFNELKEMQRAVKAKCVSCRCGLEGTSKTIGLTHRHRNSIMIDEFGNVHIKPLRGEIGLIFLHKNGIKEELIAHEMTHAMLYTVQSYTNVINFMDPRFSLADERMAQITGQLVESFYKQNI